MKRFVVCSLLALTLAAPAPATADVVATTNMDGGWVGINGWAWYVGDVYAPLGITNEAAAQEFIVDQGGTLTTITASVDRFIGGAPLIVSVYTAVNRRPADLLGSVAVPESEIDSFLPSPLNTFDLSGLGITLEEGEHYIVTFTVATPGAVRYRARLNATNVNSYGIPGLHSDNGGLTWHTHTAVTVEIGLVVSVADPLPPPPLEVAVDVLPDSSDNFINLKLHPRKDHSLPVVVFGDEAFDVESVVPTTILFGDPALTDIGAGDPVAPASLAYADYDGDGRLDLLLEFDLSAMLSSGAIDADSASLRLSGYRMDQSVIYGSDSISTSRPKGRGRR